ESIVASTAAVLAKNVSTPDQIRLALEHLLTSAEFQDPAHRMTKFKRPLDWFVAFARAAGIPYSTDSDFNSRFNDLGQPTYGWREPEGPPEVARPWMS